MKDDYMIKKREQVLECIKPICEAFKIDDYDYIIDDGKERLRIYDIEIECACNSIDEVKMKLIGFYVYKNMVQKQKPWSI